jgi:hypothetical protein
LQEGNRYGVEHHVTFQVLLVHHLVLEEHHAKPLPRYRSQVTAQPHCPSPKLQLFLPVA